MSYILIILILSIQAGHKKPLEFMVFCFIVLPRFNVNSIGFQCSVKDLYEILSSNCNDLFPMDFDKKVYNV